ncbi:MAG: hypothetical protein Q7T29_06230 [Gallionella sp.]|nr:hypothetical protein [Gallionella sp.]
MKEFQENNATLTPLKSLKVGYPRVRPHPLTLNIGLDLYYAHAYSSRHN